MYSISEQGQRYCVRQLHRYDFTRQSAYQRLRAEILVKQFGWELPIDERGRERDRYDKMDEDRVQISCVYGKGNRRDAECLLGGVRTLILNEWDDAMTMNEFHTVGMIPTSTLHLLKERYNPKEILEITRLCVRRGRIYKPHWPITSGSSEAQFHLDTARDLVYATVYALSEQTQRKLALLVVDRYYFKVMRRSHFVFEELYSHPQGGRGGYSLTILDLPATIFAIEQVGDYGRIQRMLSLCTQPLTTCIGITNC